MLFIVSLIMLILVCCVIMVITVIHDLKIGSTFVDKENKDIIVQIIDINDDDTIVFRNLSTSEQLTLETFDFFKKYQKYKIKH